MYLAGLAACSAPTQQIGIDYTTCVHQGGVPATLNNGTQTVCNYPAKCDTNITTTNLTQANQNTNANVATSSNQNTVSPNVITAVSTQVSPNISPNMSQQSSTTSGAVSGSSGGGGSGGGSTAPAGGAITPYGGLQYGANGQLIGQTQVYERFGQPVPGHTYQDYFSPGGEMYYDPANKLTYPQWLAKQQQIANDAAAAKNATTTTNSTAPQDALRAQFLQEQAARDAYNAEQSRLAAEAAAKAKADAAAAGATPSQQNQAAQQAVAEVKANAAPLPSIIPNSDNPNPASFAPDSGGAAVSSTPWGLIAAVALGIAFLTQDNNHVPSRH